MDIWAGLGAAALLAMVLNLLLAVSTWPRRRRSPVLNTLLVALLGAAMWCLASGLWFVTGRQERWVALSLVGTLLGATTLVVAALCKAALLAYRPHLIRPANALLVSAPTLLCLPLIAVPATRPLLLQHPAPGESIALAGPLLLAVMAYLGLAAGVAAVTMVPAATGAVAAQRPPMLAGVASLVVPLGAVGLACATPDMIARSVLLPLAVTVTTVTWWWVEGRGDRISQVPITAARVLREVSDALVVLDGTGRVIHANPTARSVLLRPSAPELTGLQWAQVADEALLSLPDDAEGRTVTTSGGQVVQLKVGTVRVGGRQRARVLIARDVTELEALRHHLDDLASRDPMTGARNRRHLNVRLPTLVEAARLTGTPLCAAMLDLDHFKEVNDEHGHAMGDRVIIAVVQDVSDALRAEDVLVRTGGDEFLVLLPATTADEAIVVVDRLRAGCAQLRFATRRDPVRVALSAGVAELAPGWTGDDLLAAADRALYRAKSAGRDRVSL